MRNRLAAGVTVVGVLATFVFAGATSARADTDVAVKPTERPAVYVTRCERAIKRWSKANPELVEQAQLADVECVWEPGRFSGIYTSATRVVTINAWGMFHWGIRPAAFYDVLLFHEVAHAWGDVDGRLKGREAEYATIRGIPVGEVVEDHATLVVLALADQFVDWGDPRETFVWSTRPTYDQIAALRTAGLIP